MTDRNRRFIYDENGNTCGFQCAVLNGDKICGALISTAAGFNRHLARKHGINKQESLFEQQELPVSVNPANVLSFPLDYSPNLYVLEDILGEDAG